MPIFDQGYQHWNGPLAGHAWRWLAITRQGVRAQWKNKAVRFSVISGLFPALILSVMLIIYGLFEQKSDLLTPFLGLFQNLPDAIKNGPRAYRRDIWTLAFHYFFTFQIFFSMVIVLLVGPDLISQDLRFNAIPLYFSRPLRRIDYFLGKLGVIGFYIGLVTVAPVLLAYSLGLAFSLEFSVITDTWRLLLSSLALCGLIIVSSGTLMLAFSSLSRNSRYVGAIWVGVWILSNITADALTATVKADWCPTVSYTNNLLRVREALLDTATAQENLSKLVQAGTDQVRDAVIPFPLNKVARRRPPRPPGRPPSFLPALSTYSWTWSAGVLGGLFAMSALVLTTRVKSLDRLK